MKSQSLLAVGLTALWLAGCAGGGAVLSEPPVTQSDVNQARQALATHRLAPSLNLANDEQLPRLDQVWQSMRPAIRETCRRVFSNGCDKAMNQMGMVLVPNLSVNAYADASRYTIGIHQGFLLSAGDDDEIAAVIAHEAAHLMFGHAQKKAASGTNAQLLTGALALALGAATQNHALLNNAGDMSMNAYQAGYVAYSPQMELEADQFAMYVLKEARRRLTAGTDLIVRLHRGEVPAPVRHGSGWAGYLATHPADDFRLAAMQATLNDIKNGAIRPISKAEREAQEHERIARQNEARQRAVFESPDCVALRREYPDCKWWQGEYDWKYIVRCPSPFGNACQ